MNKQTFFKFKTFKSQTKNTFSILKFNFWPLIFFKIIYTFCGSILIYPVALFLLNRTLAAARLTFISGFNFSQIFTHPLAWVIIFVLLLFLAFFVLLELSTLIILFNESYFKRKIRVFPLLKAGFQKSLTLIKPQNILLILFVVVVIPITNIGFSSSFITKIKIPEFIMDFIYNSPMLHLSFILLSLFIGILMIYWIFCISAFVLDNKSFFNSIRESCGLVKKRFWKTVLTLGFWNVFIFSLLLACLLLFLLMIGIPTCIFLASYDIIQHGTLFFSILIGFIAVISTTLLSFVKLIITPLNLSLISTLYYDYSADSGFNRKTTPMVIQREKSPFKKRTVIIVSSIIFAFMITLQSFHVFVTLQPDNINEALGVPQVSAHRGSSTKAPENTLAALEGAIADDADYVEIDVAQTKDGVVVVSHDNNLKRVSGHDINIWESNYADIKDLDIGSFFDPKFSDQRIPTLEEAIETCKNKIKMNIELKPTGHEKSLVDSTLAIINKEFFRNDCFLASLDYPTIEDVLAKDPDQRVAYITPIALGNIDTLPVDIFSIEATFVTPELVESIHRRGKQIHVWTVDHEDMINEMINMNVDNLITDDVPLAKETIKNTPQKDNIFEKVSRIIFDY